MLCQWLQHFCWESHSAIQLAGDPVQIVQVEDGCSASSVLLEEWKEHEFLPNINEHMNELIRGPDRRLIKRIKWDTLLHFHMSYAFVKCLKKRGRNWISFIFSRIPYIVKYFNSKCSHPIFKLRREIQFISMIKTCVGFHFEKIRNTVVLK